MNTLIEKHLEKIKKQEKLECWYIVKQDTTFWKQCYYVYILEKYNNTDSEENLKIFFERETEKINEKLKLNLTTNYRALKVAFYYGLIEDLEKKYQRYDESVITPVYKKIKQLTNTQFEKVELYENIMIQQIEKMYISSEIDEKSKDLRSNFHIFPVIFLYKILLELGKSTGKYEISYDEYKYFLSVQENYSEFLNTLLLIIESRENSEIIESFKEYKDKLDSRLNNVIEQLNSIFIINKSKFISLKNEKIEYAEKVIRMFEDNIQFFENLNNLDNSYTNFLISDDSFLKNSRLNTAEKSLKNIIGKPHQRIFFGAPGTGKSYEVSKLIEKTYPNLEEKENPFVFRTTIYKDYSYYDFVGTIMPVNDGEKITYQFKPGIFTEALFKAIKSPGNDVFLVIEEMSRGNISGIFGDIFQLLDRDKEGNSEYSISNDLISKYFSEKGMTGFDKIILPSNLHIIGTVNTSDQNVNVIDTAFKRRFDFVYSDVSPIKNNETGEYLNSYIFELEDEKFEWNKFYMTINDFIVEELSLSEDKQIGQFFIKFDNYTTAEDKFNAIKNKLLHYLWEDVKEASFRETNIFKENKSFLKLYKDFEKKKNIFSGNFMKKYEELVLTDE